MSINPQKLKVRDVILKSEELLARTTVDSKFVPEKGNKSCLFDKDGKKVVDFTSFVGVCNLGYGINIERIRKSVRKHEDETGLCHVMTHDWHNEWASSLAEKLCEITPGNFRKKVFFSSTGAEANEAAVKLLLAARPERKYFIAFNNAFHGRTLGVLPLMSGKLARTKRFPVPYPVIHFPFPQSKKNDSGAVDLSMTPERYIESIMRYFETVVSPEEINGAFVELVQGEGGINPAEVQFLGPLLELFKTFDIKLVVDEVQTGFGRTGKMFACEHYDVVPDVITLAKGIAAGVGVLGATVFNSELDFKEKGRHSNTFGGNSSACVAALENIEIVKEILVDGDRQRRFFFEVEEAIRFINIKSRGIKLSMVRGMGWMLGFDVLVNEKYSVDAANEIIECAEENGILLIGCGKSAIRFMPPITIANDEVSLAMSFFKNLSVWSK